MTNEYRRLYQITADQPPPPCEVFNCEKQRICAKFKCACVAFQVYASKGRALDPRIKLRRESSYKISKTTGKLRLHTKQKIELGGQINATRKIYRKIFEED